MKLIDETHSSCIVRKGLRSMLILLLLFLTFQFSCFSQDEDVENWYRRSHLLQLDYSNNTFLNSDTLLSLFTKGDFLKSDEFIVLSHVEDSVIHSDTLTILEWSSSKISFKGPLDTRITFLDQGKLITSSFSFESIFRGLLGMLALVVIAFIFSRNKRKINWKLVLKGILLQAVLAILILKVPFVESVFDLISKAFVRVVDMAHAGAEFVFGSVITGEMSPVVKNFATWILPSVIFFSALSSLLYYWGVLQKIVLAMAYVMKRLMGLSGAESVSAAGNVFLGQTEAPLLVKPYLNKMTDSEILCLMAGGMATIAGGVLASYIGFLGGEDPLQKVFFAKHLLTASLMSAPAAIVFAKIILPETEEINEDLSVSQDKIGSNALEAIANGTTDGLKLAVNVAAMLIVFVSLIALANYILFQVGDFTGLNGFVQGMGNYDGLSFQFVVGYVLSPVAWLMGVPWQDTVIIGQLLGEKTIINEFVAYPHLGQLQDEITAKSLIMGTYVLCGFANFASIGIQVGGIGALAPEKRATLAKYGFYALVVGTLACMMTATMVGVFY